MRQMIICNEKYEYNFSDKGDSYEETSINYCGIMYGVNRIVNAWEHSNS